MNKTFILPSETELCLSVLEESGHKAYIVGGAVRDFLMCRAVHDYDICTDAHPNEVIEAFKGYRVIETGLKHGTVTVLINSEPIEITTFRTEGSYSDGRHPDTVDFTKDIVKDLSRRDFTVNAIAYSKTDGFVDPFNGISDIDKRIVRCVGNAEERLTEDALRILRAIRFASVLRFNIEEDTSKALFKLKERLSLVSKERIREELKKLICGGAMMDIMTEYRGIVALIIPQLGATFDYCQNNPHHDFDLYTHLLKTVESLPSDPILRLTGLLHDIGKPHSRTTDESGISHYYSHASIGAEIAEDILKDLRFSKTEINRAVTLIRYHDGVIEESEKAVNRRLNKLGAALFFDLLDLQRADNASQKADSSLRFEHNEALRAIARGILEKEPCFSLSSLDIDGNDLIALGYRGKEIGNALSLLLDAVMSGDVENKKGALTDYLSNLDIKN